MTFCLPAAAQSDADEGEEADNEPLVEEIVVTATYRDTNLMDTPVTISALTDIELEQRGVEDITSMFLAIPGLNYGNATNTWHRVVARGIAQFRAPTSPVSIYVDNVPVTGTSSRQPRLPNFDLERIEVLKGAAGHAIRRRQHGGGDPLHHQEAQSGGLRLGVHDEDFGPVAFR